MKSPEFDQSLTGDEAKWIRLEDCIIVRSSCNPWDDLRFFALFFGAVGIMTLPTLALLLHLLG